jgi:hypothetical protein
MVYSPQSSPQPIDREQVRQQLNALGYKPGDTVYLRAFYPDSDPRKPKDAGRKAEATKLDQLIKHAATFQSEGRGVYFVVNGGGHKDIDVTEGRGIFYEHDNLEKSLQIDLWKSLGLPEPTFQNDTGGKSIHSYWVFDESVIVENWRSLQTDLLEFADADRSIKNPSRVMRLAGAWHSSGKQSRIISNSGNRYSYEDLRAIVPAPKPETPLFQAKQPRNNPDSSGIVPKRCEDIALPVPASVPLEKCLAVSSRDLLNGVSEGGRNNAGHKLACDLIGATSCLQAIGQSFDGDAESLFQDFGDRCNPPLNAGELQSIWKSAQGSNPSPACKEEGVENCIRGWYWKNHAEKGSGRVIGVTRNNVVTHSRFAPPDPAEQTEQFATIYKAGLFGHKLTKALQPLGFNLQQTRKNYEEYVEEIDQEEQRADRKTDVEKLISISKRRLTLENYLHPSLAEPIKKVATWMGVDRSCAHTLTADRRRANQSQFPRRCQGMYQFC